MQLPGDWSFGNFKNKAGGLLTDPQQQMALMQNPMFNMGMGILSENFKPHGGNPAMGILGGLQNAQATTQAEEDRKRIAELRQEIQRWFQQQNGGKAGGMSPATPLPQTLMSYR